ncbi:zinc finger CCCH domain-containing protein 14-like isoform X2 [Cucurbita maxima]|uniref:Zinc finger CCCH domain-containing protein 14-like isoform X2 n=1 Tax=Cucurbita maxima TaxID=3661 RepID=A0A6J1JPT5_CUCMA|nr:zinc finger CCCH domain-containing protein 14-like isoform X2 [Cucurbita maxima]
MEDDMCPPLPSSLSSTAEASPNSPEPENLCSLHFVSMYHSIFPPLLSSSSLSFTPSPSSSSSSSADDDFNNPCTATPTSTTDDLLFQARLILEHRELCQRHDLCLRRLRQVTDDVDCLQRENAQLRLANAELIKILSSKTAVDDLQSLIGGGQNGEEVGYEIISPTSVIRKYNSQFDGRNNRRRTSLPKSISVRSAAASAAAAPLNIHGGCVVRWSWRCTSRGWRRRSCARNGRRAGGALTGSIAGLPTGLKSCGRS